VIDAPAPLQWTSGLKIAGLSGDGRNAIVMLAEKELVIVRQTTPGKFGPLESYPLADENCYGLVIFDVDGDGRPDLLYLAPDARDPLRIRLQLAEGGFGPEQSYQIDAVRGPVELLRSANGQARLACIRRQTGQLEILSLARAAAGAEAGRCDRGVLGTNRRQNPRRLRDWRFQRLWQRRRRGL